MRQARLALIPILALTLLAHSPRHGYSQSPETGGQEYRWGEVVVELKPGADIESVNSRNSTATIERLFGTNFYRLLVPEGKPERKWMKRLLRDAEVVSASLNPIVISPSRVFGRSIVGFPGDRAVLGRSRDEYQSHQDLYKLLNLDDIQLRSRGSGIVVAVIDTGVDRNHPDIAHRLWRDVRPGGESGVEGSDTDQDGLTGDTYGWDFVDNDNDPSEGPGDPAASVTGHGTFIAGLISLVAPDCRILPVRAFTPDGVSNAFTVAAAIKYAADHGAHVINLSFGSPKSSRIIRDAVKYARQRGAFLVAAAGNEGEDTDGRPIYPANFSGVLSVAALDSSSRKAIFSNFGNDVAVSALGDKLISTYPGRDGETSGYAMWSGTSFAAPLAAAEAALILAQEKITNVRETIENTADAIDDLNPAYEGKLGKGRINPLAAVDRFNTSPAPSGNYATIYMAPSTEDPVQGVAKIFITGRKQEFTISVRSLKPRVKYHLRINGKKVRPEGFYATSFGGLSLGLSNESEPLVEWGMVQISLPPELAPVTRIKQVRLLEGDREVLRGDFSPAGSGRGGQLFYKRAPLLPTLPYSESGGRAFIKIEAGAEELRVEADRLLPGATYSLYVDGSSIGSAVARTKSSNKGYLLMRLSGDGEEPLPSTLRPVTGIRQVELRDFAGRVVLQGEFLPGGEDLGGGNSQ